MARTDAMPVESPDGKALASGALLTVLMDTLVKKGILSKFEAFSVITTAQTELALLPDSPIYNDARFILKKMLTRFPAQ
jgi:hypothetical protein